MYRWCRLAFLALAACLFLAHASADEKKPPTVKGWGTVTDPDGDCRVKEEGGKLTIAVPKTWHDLTYSDQYSKLNAPRVLQEVQGPFTVQVKVSAFPLPEKDTASGGQFSFTSAGILLWQDDKNFIRMDRAAEGSVPTPFVWVERFHDGKAVSRKSHQLADKDTELRVERTGNTFTFSAREAGGGDDWTEVTSEDADLPRPLRVGVLAINTTTKTFAPQFEGLKLTPKK